MQLHCLELIKQGNPSVSMFGGGGDANLVGQVTVSISHRSLGVDTQIMGGGCHLSNTKMTSLF